MKRTLAISLWLALGASAIAQNPAAARNGAQSAAKAVAKPAQVSVKVVPVAKAAPAKPVAVSAKPAVVNVKPVAVSAKPAAQKPVVIAAKPMAQSKPVVVAAKPTGQVKPSVVAAKPAAQPKTAVVAVKVSAKPAVPAKGAPMGGKPVAVVVPSGHAGIVAKTPVRAAKPAVVAVAKPEPHKSEKAQTVAVNSAPGGKGQAADSADDKKTAPQEEQSVAQNGRRDPFVSPIVTMSSLGSGCSTGKRCLAIDQINLKGIVKSETGMIAVVVNAAEKAYFLRENDPVFNGYVVKITGDSIVFKETFRDKLGKPLTRDITKTISRPVA